MYSNANKNSVKTQFRTINHNVSFIIYSKHWNLFSSMVFKKNLSKTWDQIPEVLVNTMKKMWKSESGEIEQDLPQEPVLLTKKKLFLSIQLSKCLKKCFAALSAFDFIFFFSVLVKSNNNLFLLL